MKLTDSWLAMGNEFARHLLEKARKEGLTNTNQLAKRLDVDPEALERVLAEGARPNARTMKKYESYLHPIRFDFFKGGQSAVRRTEPQAASSSHAKHHGTSAASRRPAVAPMVVAVHFPAMSHAIQTVRASIEQLTSILPHLVSLERHVSTIEEDPLIQEILASPTETREALGTILRQRSSATYQRHPNDPAGRPSSRTTSRSTHAKPGTGSHTKPKPTTRAITGSGKRTTAPSKRRTATASK